MTIADLVNGLNALAAAEGLSREDALRRFGSAYLGEDLAVFRASAGFPVVQLKDAGGVKRAPGSDARLSAADRELIGRSGLREADVLANMPAPRKRPAAPGVLTEHDRAEIRRMGMDPDAVAAQMARTGAV